MIKKSLLTLLSLGMHICFLYAQQITTDNSQQPEQLIQNLVGNNCASVSNISSQINGNINNIISYGSFDNGTSNFPLQSGLVLSTGNVARAGNAFIGEDLSDGEIDWETDTDILNVLGIDQTLNATSIEFDFVTVNNFVVFNYLFASDEYQQEYPCNFSDVFAILIKRAGTADPYVNIATVSDDNTHVSTNTIHPDISGFCDAINEDYFKGYNVGSTNFNGHTNVLTANSTVIPGETYHIKFVIADHIDERFDSAVFIEAEGFGGAIDLGPDQSICGNDLTLDADINNPSANYAWYLNGAQIAGETSPTLGVAQSGTYTVEVSIPISGGDCTMEDTIEIEIIPFQPAAPIDDLPICDPAPSDGFYDFDFPLLKDDEIYAELPSTNYTISYHHTEDDALNNTNPIQGIYQNTEQTEQIFVRIESLSGDCLQIGSFNIAVNSSPNTLETTAAVCNGQINDGGFIISSLSHFDFELSNYEFNRTVSYYLTENDALNNQSPITETDEIIGSPDFIYARVADASSDCSSIERLNLDYQAQPDIGIDTYIVSQCTDPEYFETSGSNTITYDNVSVGFNLDDIFDEIESTYPGITVQVAVLLGITSDPRIYNTTSPIATIPLLLRFEGENCPTPLTLELHKNVLYNIFGEESTVSRCDDFSNDGVYDFDFNDVSNELSQGQDDIQFTFYETEDDRDNEENPISQFSPYTVNTPSKELFFTSTYNDCVYDSKVVLEINEAPVVSPQTVEACGEFNDTTNNTTVQLSPFNNLMAQGLNGVSVTFYATQQDAENNENTIESIDVAGNSTQVFSRITTISTGCFNITTLDITILESLDIDSPSPIVVCDDNQDGFSIVNLESVISDLSIDENDFDISFYETFENALSDRFAIENPESYNAQTQSVYIRLQRVGLDCFTVVDFEVLIYDNPILNSIADFVNCTTNGANFADFYFEDKDSEIINGQEGMQVSYYETEDDAINRVDEIDKTSAYQNTSNPQTVYVRLENETENSCYRVAPMQIEVKEAPIYNVPSDVFECDINNNGLAATDLNDKIAEISLGSPSNLNITFHLTPLNAELGTNEIPLDYTPSNNPQLIYSRVENIDSGCYNIDTFYINTLSLPEVNYGQSLTTCANNYEFEQQWDLTEIELLILEGRQYGIDFTYFETEADLFADINSINNPETYTNSLGQQTLYVRVRNSVTTCFASVPFDLIINSPPEIDPIDTYEVCANAESYVDLSDIDLALLEDTFNVLVSYHTSEADAEANIGAINTDYTYTNTVETLFARVAYSTTGCYAVHPFQLVINPLPVANQPNDLVACDDDYDGLLEFDLSSQDSAVLGNQNPNEYSVSYFSSENEATENINELDVEHTAFDGEVIFVRVENLATGCFDITQFSVVINPLPDTVVEDQVLCLNDLPLTVSADTGNPLDTYLWSTNETSSEIEITEVGSYAVTITNQYGCQSTSTFNVTESESAVIDIVETIDFSDPNNITVTVNGIGDYLYQLNDLPFQTSNVFVNVPIGYNTITIIDQNGCARITREVLVFDAPKHLTPNDDGDFDTWHIASVQELPGTRVHIFDRYGKLLKEIGHNTSGWDGTFNGNEMPSGDYWYIAYVIKDGESFQVKGHFALKR
ncbi:choice-of-anchor L domain-containing protein [Winogradskyella ouciana]|uniref:choice-of-anchor L domain-containing protein n=1 Tax=Winogradskyella ouciana TaxID=2608631 RepID=UPI003D2A0257